MIGGVLLFNKFMQIDKFQTQLELIVLSGIKSAISNMKIEEKWGSVESKEIK
jgi:hypothetical protein